MKNLYLFIVIALLFNALSAQSQFKNIVSLSPDYDIGKDVVEAPDGGYAAIGDFDVFGPTGYIHSRAFFMKLDANGDTLFVKRYLFPYYISLQDIIVTSDNKYMVCGNVTGAGLGDILLMKLELNGDTIWTRHYGTSVLDVSTALIEDEFGNFICTGNSLNSGTGYDVFVTKFNSVGDSLWTYLNTSSYLDKPYDIAVLHDNSFAICGCREVAYNEPRLFIAKIGYNGSEVWFRDYGNTTEGGHGLAISETPDSNIIVAGFQPYNMTTNRGMLMTTDSDGNIISNILSATSPSVKYFGLDFLDDTTYFVCGEESEIFDGAFYHYNTTKSSVYVSKRNINGGIIWSRYIEDNFNGVAFSVCATSDNGCVVTGALDVFATDTSSFFIWKLDPDGNSDLICPEEHADFTYSIAPGNYLTFSDSTTTGLPVSMNYWQFGYGHDTSFSATTVRQYPDSGSYYVFHEVLTQPNNCSYSIDSTITIGNSICQDAAIEFQIGPASYYNTFDGSIDLIVSGMQTPMSYIWSNDETTSQISGLYPGSYCVTVTDSWGCIKTKCGLVGYLGSGDADIIDSSTRIEVCFTASHTWVSDLGFYLVAPGFGIGEPNPSIPGQYGVVELLPSVSAWYDGVTSLSSSVLGCASSGDVGTNCNGGDNLSDFCFTSELPAGNPSFTPCVCDLPAPLSGSYASAGSWANIYDCAANQSGWKLQIYDCIGADIGYFTGGKLTIVTDQRTYIYESVNLNEPINDNACSYSAASTFTVPLVFTYDTLMTDSAGYIVDTLSFTVDTCFGNTTLEIDSAFVAYYDVIDSSTVSVDWEIWFSGEIYFITTQYSYGNEGNYSISMNLVCDSEYGQKTIHYVSVYDVINISYDMITNVNMSEGSMLSVFPNPVKGILQIRTNYPVASIEIADINGRLVYTTDPLNEDGSKIDVSEFKAGVYYIKIYTPSEIFSRKFVKLN